MMVDRRCSGACVKRRKKQIHRFRRSTQIGLSYSKPRISGFLKRTLKRKTFFSSE